MSELSRRPAAKTHRPVVHRDSRAAPRRPGKTSRQTGLGLYIAISLVVHALFFLSAALVLSWKALPQIKRLEVYLKPLDLPPPLPAPAELVPEPLVPPPAVKPVHASDAGKLLESAQGKPKPVPEKTVPQPEAQPRQGLAPQVRKQLAEQVQAFYPDEYVQQRIEGDVVLKLFVDGTSGKVLAIRVETPSPYPLFNDAARQAALTSVQSLAPGMPAEVLLPVRFRLGN